MLRRFLPFALCATALVAQPAGHGKVGGGAVRQPPAGDNQADEKRRNESLAANQTKEAVAARSRWETEGRTLRTLLRKLAGLTANIDKLRKELSAAQKAYRQLQRDKEIALEELRRGDFCSGCGMTRSQIEGSGQRFPHPGQVRRPARPEDFKKLEDDYAGRLRAAKSKIERLEQERSQKSGNASDLHFEFMNRRPVYHREIAREGEFRLRAWNTEKAQLENQLDGIRDRLASLQRGAHTEPTADDGAVRALERDLGEQTQRAESDYLRAEQEANAYVLAATRDLQETSKAAQPIIALEGVPSGWFLSSSILSPPTAVSCRLLRIRQREGGAHPGARSLLEGGGAKPRSPPGTASPKTVRDLLEGK